MQEARLARSEAEQATALAKAEARRCQELAAKLKEAARTKGDGGSGDGCDAAARRWVRAGCCPCEVRWCQPGAEHPPLLSACRRTEELGPMEEPLPAERCDPQLRDKAAAGQVGAALGAAWGCRWGAAGAVPTGLVLGAPGCGQSTRGPRSCHWPPAPICPIVARVTVREPPARGPLWGRERTQRSVLEAPHRAAAVHGTALRPSSRAHSGHCACAPSGRKDYESRRAPRAPRTRRAVAGRHLEI